MHRNGYTYSACAGWRANRKPRNTHLAIKPPPANWLGPPKSTSTPLFILKVEIKPAFKGKLESDTLYCTVSNLYYEIPAQLLTVLVDEPDQMITPRSGNTQEHTRSNGVPVICLAEKSCRDLVYIMLWLLVRNRFFTDASPTKPGACCSIHRRQHAQVCIKTLPYSTSYSRIHDCILFASLQEWIQELAASLRGTPSRFVSFLTKGVQACMLACLVWETVILSLKVACLQFA
jgi:hypothetical protein